jgi:hypothetical protein
MTQSKTEAIGSPDELWQKFSQLYREEEFPRVLWRPSPSLPEVRIETLGVRRILAAETDLHPSRRLLAIGDTGDSRLILCPSLAEPLARDLRAAGINHADLNGRLYLNLEEPPMLIDRRPEARRFANPVSQSDVFAPKSTRLLRTLLSRRDEPWTQAALAERSGLSRGLVSRLVRTLIEDGYVKPGTPATRQQAGTWRLTDFDRLLDAWKEADDWGARTHVQQYSVLAGDVLELAGEVRVQLRREFGEGGVAFTQWFAARLRHAYTDSPIVSVYVRKRSEVVLQFARPVSSGGNLWLISPKEDGVFRETQHVQGFPLVSDVQIYLDLLQVGGRGPEQAEALRKWGGFAT